ncbi:MAG TPA: hypothetical protein IAA98_11580 [Candidatus Avipropionibacterium avicola]|uniref:Uncharacterized protein n=1 Tax=Candidatus Avipropionibacterium avicola TaxID=2840701 RepID=A0A9D1KME0_9ACTN|nr:hypothetical protein [Candidatus Avipropionibacterium avicola]
MSRPPRWAQPARGDDATTLEVAVSGPAGIAAARRAATAAYVWARRQGLPLPDLERVCRVGGYVVIPFSERLPEEIVEQFRQEFPDLYNDGATSSILGSNTTGGEVQSVQPL